MKNILKKLCLFIMVPLLILVGFSSWVIVGEKGVHIGVINSSGAVAYINDRSRLYTSIEGALYKANDGDVVHVLINSENANKTITRNCTIKSGVTLNITHQDGFQQVENSDGVVVSTLTTNNTKSLSLQNTVNVADGITIINNGTLIISGELSSGSAGGDVGHTAGKYSKLVLGENSSVINNGKIQCCGFIAESIMDNGSKVTTNNGGVISLPFVMIDFRGGSTSYGIYKEFSSKEVSPFNQFELRNVEALNEIKFGGKLNGYGNIQVSGITDPILSSSLVKMVGASDEYFASLIAKDQKL